MIVAPFGTYIQYFEERMQQPRSFTMAAASDAAMLMLTTAIALFFVLRGNIQQHRQWMTRSYAVALVFLEVRVISGVFGFDNSHNGDEIIVWMCVIFSVPIADIVLNWREFKRGKITQQQSCCSKSSLGTIDAISDPLRLLPLRRCFAFLVHVLDAGLVDQQVGRAGAVHLQAVLVVPLDDAVNFFAVLQHQDHGRLGLHLLLIIEILGVGLLRRRSLLAVRAVATISAIAVRSRRSPSWRGWSLRFRAGRMSLRLANTSGSTARPTAVASIESFMVFAPG